MKNRKVIGIGFHKTGTTTLDIVLKDLGYKVLGPRTDLASYLLEGDHEFVLNIADEYNAYQDNPWPLLYKKLDKRYPGSKFILTLRDEEKWISSIVNHFSLDVTKMREWIYGVGHPKGNERLYLEKYKEHNREVKAYFKNREEDLLVVNWANGDEWAKICNFLNEPIPNKPFPHANKGIYFLSKKNTKRFRELKKRLKKLLFIN